MPLLERVCDECECWLIWLLVHIRLTPNDPIRWTQQNDSPPLPTTSCVLRSQPDEHVTPFQTINSYITYYYLYH
jgi:hypothetical protein